MVTLKMAILMKCPVCGQSVKWIWGRVSLMLKFVTWGDLKVSLALFMVSRIFQVQPWDHDSDQYVSGLKHAEIC